MTVLQDCQVHRRVLSNGITVLAMENAAADIVAARLFLRAGSRCESLEQAGLAHLVSTVITKGTVHLSSQEIAERVESVGASLWANAAADYFLMNVKTVSADFPNLLALVSEILRSPTFPESEFELEQRQTLNNIRSRREQPFMVAADQLRQVMYPSHPYGIPILGEVETVAQLGRADLQAFHQTYFRPDNLVISLAGRLVPEVAIALIEDLLGDWSSPSTALPKPKVPAIAPQPQRCVTAQETQQSVIMLGYLAPGVDPQPSVDYPDYFALKLLSTYLGNGLSSRLFVELREKQGLAYDVSALYPTYWDQSQFSVYIGTAPENTTIAWDGLRRECDRLCTTPLSLDDLQVAQNKLLGQYALGKQTNTQIAHMLGWYEILDLGYEFDTQFPAEVRAMTPDIAQAVASQYLSEPYVSLVGPASLVEELQES